MSQSLTWNALRGKREVKNARNCSRSSADKEQARWEEHWRMLIVLVRESLELSEKKLST